MTWALWLALLTCAVLQVYAMGLRLGLTAAPGDHPEN
jgi:hypothetical protein